MVMSFFIAAGICLVLSLGSFCASAIQGHGPGVAFARFGILCFGFLLLCAFLFFIGAGLFLTANTMIGAILTSFGILPWAILFGLFVYDCLVDWN